MIKVNPYLSIGRELGNLAIVKALPVHHHRVEVVDDPLRHLGVKVVRVAAGQRAPADMRVRGRVTKMHSKPSNPPRQDPQRVYKERNILY